MPSTSSLRSGASPTLPASSQSTKSATGSYWSWKMNRNIQWRSVDELNAFKILDASPRVSKFHRLWFLFPLCLKNMTLQLYPALLVRSDEVLKIWKIITASGASTPKSQQRQVVLWWVRRYNLTVYRIIPRNWLAQQPQLENIDTILKWGAREIHPKGKKAALRLILSAGGITWSDCKAKSLGPHTTRYICRLVLEGRLDFVVNKPLEKYTVFTPCTPQTSRLNLFGV